MHNRMRVAADFGFRIVLVVSLLAVTGAAFWEDSLGGVGDFTLTERSGRTVSKSDLLGKTWIASFQFTRCTQGCPQISTTMEALQKDLQRFPNVRLVTFTVDPEHDHPEELSAYATHYNADPERWLFLTGDEKTIYPLMEKSFHLPEPRKTTTSDPGNAVQHSFKLVLVDRRGHIRGYYDGRPDSRSTDPKGDFEAEMHKLKATIAWEYERFPRLNALLNSTTFLLLVMGFLAIRFRLLALHVSCMLTALALSVFFLAFYFYDHGVVKQGLTTSFAMQTSHAHPPAWVGIVYQVVLWTHTPLAAVIAPLALYTVYLALRRRFARHRAVARWTLPIWLYVAGTGVAIYWMLYRLYPWP